MEDYCQELDYTTNSDNEWDKNGLSLQLFSDAANYKCYESHDSKDRSNKWKFFFTDALSFFKISIIAWNLTLRNTFCIFKQERWIAFKTSRLIRYSTLLAVRTTVNANKIAHVRCSCFRTLLVARTFINVVKIVSAVTCQACICRSFTS